MNRHSEAIGLLRLAPGYSVDPEGTAEREGVLLAGVHQKRNA